MSSSRCQTAQSLPSEQETLLLLEQHAAGRPEALESLLDRHRSEIRQVVGHRLCPALQVRVDGSDIAQETLLEAANRIDEFLADEPIPFRWWLRKLALQHLGKARSRHQTASKRSIDSEQRLPSAAASSVAVQLAAMQPSPDSEVATNELVDYVQKALAQLANIDQELLTMRYYEKLNNVEIGYLLDLTPEAVSKRHARCLLRLRVIIRELVDDSELT